MSDIHAEIQQAQRRPTVTQVLERMQPDIARAIPKGLDPDRVSRLALTVIRQSEMAKQKGTAKTSLSECTPESFAGALLTAVALGLEPGIDGEAWLIPYGKEATFIPGYRGICKLFWQHPLARHLDAQAVFANDDFDYELGLHPSLRHKPARGDRGEITHFYAVASLSTGAEKFEVMTVEEVAAVREASPRRSGDIRDPQHWMERKTVLKQLLKVMPKSTRLQYALDADERPGTELSQQHVPDAITRPEPAALAATAETIDPATGEILPGEQAAPVEHVTIRPEDIPPDVTPPTASGSHPPKPEDSDGEKTGTPPEQPADPPVEDQQTKARRPSGERRPKSADREPGPVPAETSDGGEAVAVKVETGRATSPRCTVTQQAEINGHFGRLELDDTTQRLWWLQRFAELPEGTVATTKELTRAEAIKVLAQLEQFTTRDQLDASLNQDPLFSND